MKHMTKSNIPIILWVDLETAPLGQRSKLREDFAGKPLLRQTLERVCRSQKSDRKIVFCRPEQADTVGSILNGLNVEVLPVDFQQPKWWPGLQASRRWAAECWRGGLLGVCAFDEVTLPFILADLAKKLDVPAILSVDPHSAWIDPDILDRQIEQYETYSSEYLFSFTQAPPGLAGIITSRQLLEKLPGTNKIAGTLIGYQPSCPQIDLIARPCNLSLDPAIIQTGIRFICDTKRTLALGRKLAQTLDPLTANIAEVTAEARKIAGTILTESPRELEIELVSGWPWPRGYRPSPDKTRGPIDAELIVRRVAELAGQYDDLLIYLGGFGEPSAHPQLEKIVTGFKEAGVWSIGMQSGALFDTPMAENIVSLPIDVLTLLVEVPQRELYTKVMGTDRYEHVKENIDHVMKAIQTRLQPTPLLAPAMIKTAETMELMDEFFDGWFNKVGWAIVNGYSDYAGQIPDLAVNAMAGPKRKPCRQIFRRMMILANGQVAICDQDFNNRVPVASLHEASLLDIWQTSSLRELRESHLAENYCPNPLCSRCRQWHRP
jgi:hypothetical protein